MKKFSVIVLFLLLPFASWPASITNAARVAAYPIPAPFTAYGVRVAVVDISYHANTLTVLAETSWAPEPIPFIFHNLRGTDSVRILVADAVRLTVPPVGAPFFASLTVFPDAGKPGTTSVDGDIGTNSTPTYAAAHSTADCATGTGSECSGVLLGTTENSGTKLISPCNTLSFSVIRWLLNFDTSTLTSAATVSAAVLSVKPVLIPRNDHADFVRVVTNGGASNTDYSTADYSTFGTTAQATDVNVSSFSVGVYADFTLNATGRSNISLTGVSKFGLRAGMDVNNTAPTPSDSDCLTSSSDGTIVFYDSADASGTSSDPKLVITFTVPGGKKRMVEIGKL